MDTFKILPDSDSFTVIEGETNVFIQLDGGDPRVDKDQLGAPKLVTCQWTLDEAGFDYAMAFYRKSTDFGALPFLLELVGIDGSTPNTYTCRIVPGSWKPVNQQKGLAYWVTCSLWVTAINDTSGDAALIAAYVPYQ